MKKERNKLMTNNTNDGQDDVLLDCEASIGLVGRGNVKAIDRAMREMSPILERNNVRVVYKLLYPGRLWIKREPITGNEQELEMEGVVDGKPEP